MGVYPEEELMLALRCSLSLFFIVCPLPTSKRAPEGDEGEALKPARPPGLNTPETVLGVRGPPWVLMLGTRVLTLSGRHVCVGGQGILL